MAERPSDFDGLDLFGEGEDRPIISDAADRLAVAAAWLLILLALGGVLWLGVTRA